MTHFAQIFADYVLSARDPEREKHALVQSAEVYNITPTEALILHDAAIQSVREAMRIIGAGYDGLNPKLQINSLPMFVNMMDVIITEILPLVQLGMQGGTSVDLGMHEGCSCPSCTAVNAVMLASAEVSTIVAPSRRHGSQH